MTMLRSNIGGILGMHAGMENKVVTHSFRTPSDMGVSQNGFGNSAQMRRTISEAAPNLSPSEVSVISGAVFASLESRKKGEFAFHPVGIPLPEGTKPADIRIVIRRKDKIEIFAHARHLKNATPAEMRMWDTVKETASKNWFVLCLFALSDPKQQSGLGRSALPSKYKMAMERLDKELREFFGIDEPFVEFDRTAGRYVMIPSMEISESYAEEIRKIPGAESGEGLNRMLAVQ